MSILRWIKKEKVSALPDPEGEKTVEMRAALACKNAKLKCSEISRLQNREINMQQKYSVLQ